MPTQPQEFLHLYDDILSRGRDLSLTVRGDSMGPFLRNGDVVQIRRTDPRQLKIGDIFLFATAEGEFVLHRLVRRVTEDRCLLLYAKGDAMPEVDRPVVAENVIGYVVHVRRGERVLLEQGLMSALLNYVLALFSLHRRGLMHTMGVLRLQWLMEWLRRRLTHLN